MIDLACGNQAINKMNMKDRVNVKHNAELFTTIPVNLFEALDLRHISKWDCLNQSPLSLLCSFVFPCLNKIECSVLLVSSSLKPCCSERVGKKRDIDWRKMGLFVLISPE